MLQKGYQNSGAASASSSANSTRHGIALRSEILYWDYIGVLLGLYRVYIGTIDLMEKNMETTIKGYKGFRLGTAPPQ